MSLCSGGGRGYGDGWRFDGEVKRRDLSGGYRRSREAVSHFSRRNWKTCGRNIESKRDEEESKREREKGDD